MGKTEMWYVIDNAGGKAHLRSGLSKKITPDEYAAMIDVNAKTLAEKSFPENDGLVHASQQIIFDLNKLKENNLQEYSDKILLIKDAIETLRNNGLTTKFPITHPKGYLAIFFRVLPLIFTLPLALAGLVNSIFPILIFRKLVGMIQDKQFISSIRIVFGAFVVPLFYILQSVIVGIFSGNTICALAYLIVSPVLFYFGSYWRKWWKELLRMEDVRLFKKIKKGEIWKKTVKAFELNF